MVTYRRSPLLASGALNELFATAWTGYAARDFTPALEAFHRAAGFAPTAAGLMRL